MSLLFGQIGIAGMWLNYEYMRGCVGISSSRMSLNARNIFANPKVHREMVVLAGALAHFALLFFFCGLVGSFVSRCVVRLRCPATRVSAAAVKSAMR